MTDGITYEITGTLVKQDGTVMVTIDRSTGDGSAVMFSTGWCADEIEANEMAQYILSLEDGEIMNLLKDDKLFPHIKGVMLKDKRTTLHLSGKVERVDIKSRERGGDDTAKAELFFTDKKKSAMINENQTLLIIDIYGSETDDWKGKPVVLYAEEGNWFGKHQWALRVDVDATRAAWKAEQSRAPVAKPGTPPKSVAEMRDAADAIETAQAYLFDEEE